MGRVRSGTLWLATALGLGIWAGEAWQASPGPAVLAAGLSWLALGAGRLAGKHLHPYGFFALALAAFFGFGLLRISLSNPANQKDHYTHIHQSKALSIRLQLTERMRPTAYSRRWIARVRHAGAAPADGRILLYFPAGTPDSTWRPGDGITLFGQIQAFSPPRNPGQFHYARFMKYQGIPGRIRVAEGAYRHRPSASAGLWGKLGGLRSHLSAALEEAGLDREPAMMMKALLLGDRSGLDPELRTAYQRAGVVHLLAISGLHVGMVMALVHLLLRPFPGRVGRLFRLLVSLLALWGYAGLAGMGAPVVRAAVMFSLWALATYLRREGQSMHFLGVAALLMLGVLNPYWLFQAGFQLSFAAVWGILAFYPALRKAWPMKGGWAGRVGGWIAVSLSAQAGVLPLSLYYFHQFPWMFLAGSLVLVPLLGVLLALGFLLLFALGFGWRLPLLPGVLDALLKAQNKGVRMLSGQEEFLVEGIRWDLIHLCFAGLVLAGLYSALRAGREEGSRRNPRSRRHNLQVRWGWYLVAAGGIALKGWGLVCEQKALKQQEWVVPHQTAKTGFWVRQGTRLEWHGGEGGQDLPGAVSDYLRLEGLDSLVHKPLKQAYRAGDRRIFRLEKDGLLPGEGYCPDILLLSHSPRVHLGRVLQKLHPDLVVADGSNYHSDLDRWAASCRAAGIPFHATARQGAFRLKLE